MVQFPLWAASSSVCGHAVRQWASEVTVKCRERELVEVKMLNSCLTSHQSVQWQRESRTTNQISERMIWMFCRSSEFHPHPSETLQILLLLKFSVPSRLWSCCVSVNPRLSISNEGQLWGRRMRGGSSSAVISQSSWMHLRLPSWFLRLPLSEVKSGGFHPVWEDEERKHR